LSVGIVVSFTKFTAVPQSPTEIPSELPCLLPTEYYFNFTDGYSGGIVFFITDRNGDGIIITDAHDSDGINPSEIPSVRILTTGFVPYTDGMYPSAKLYNGVVLVNEAKTSYDM
jgi:hypothetical protein